MTGPDMSAFQAENEPVYNKRKLDVIIEQMEANSDDRLEALRTAIQDKGYTSAAIARVLRSWGFDITADAIQKYRRGR